MNNISVWVYDDLWEDGYRFDFCPMNGNNNKFCYVDRVNASNENEAADFLATAFKFIKKHIGTSNAKADAFIYTKHGKPIVVINEDEFK